MTIIQFIILYVISDIRFSSQHFIPPLQNCIAAEMCNHSWVPICGFDKTSNKFRWFPDDCDMIEYNCDYKTDYAQTDQEKCRNNTNTDDVNKKTDVNTIRTTPGRRSNVESVLTDQDYVTSTAPYIEGKDSDDESYLEDISTNRDRSRLPDNILRRTRLVNIKTIFSPGNFSFLTTKPFFDFNNKVTMVLPSLTITNTELAEIKTVESPFTDLLRHGPQCTCGQHTTALPITSVTEMMTTITEGTTVSRAKECTRHKFTTVPTIISSTTEITPTSQVITTTELSTEANTTQAMTNLSNATFTPVSASKLMSTIQITATEPTKTTFVSTAIDQITNETTTQHASHSFDADGKCNCGKYSSPITSTTILTTTTAEPTTTSEVTMTTTTPINETDGECTCYMITTPVMTTSSMTTEETTRSSPAVSITSPTHTITTTNIETTTTSEVTTTTSTPVNETVRECTCYMNTTPVMTTSSITTEEITTSSTTASSVSTTSPTPTTITETTTFTPDSNCTCNMQTNPVTTTVMTTEVSITTTAATTTTTLPTTTIPTTTSTSSLITTTTESITTPVTNIRECTCGQRPPETRSTNESTTTRTELTTTTAKYTITKEPIKTTELTTKADPTTTNELTTTEQVTEPARQCTCYIDTTTAFITTAESSTKETTTEDITNNEIDSTTTEITPKSSKVTCSAYPTECKRPSTWETTAKGETRDFFRILKERYGNRVKMLRATTHWPLRIPKMKRFRDSFKYGRHNEG